MKMLRKISLALFCCAIITACQTTRTGKGGEPEIGIKSEDMDLTSSPKVDFYRFANGGWLERTEIPADQGRWTAFSELAENNRALVLKVLNRALESGKYPEGSDQWKAGLFYRIAMDSLLAERVGLTPIAPLLKKIDNVKDEHELREVIALLRQYGINTFFTSSVSADRRKSDQMAMYISQAGLGLPTRDYYLKTDAKSEDIKSKYKQYINDMLVFAGYASAEAPEFADQIFKLEYELAEASMDNVERRDPEKTYNKYSLEDLDAHTPRFSWTRYLAALNAPVDSLIVGQPLFLAKVNEIIARQHLTLLKHYLKWTVVNSAAPYAHHAMVSRYFDFYGKTIQGITQMRPRWKRALAATDGAVGFAVGKLYVDEVFPPEAKAVATEMVEYIKAAFSQRINRLDWMTEETKKSAQDKLTRFTVKIGYPDNWETYEALVVSNNSYLENIWAANQFTLRDNLGKLGKPVDKTEWFMTPQTVNAYYSSTFNEIVFPAAILQPPFFDFRADAAVNFGGIGAVIGHEISHGFDDNGSRYDGFGNLRNWWKEKDKKQFEERTALLAAQYDNYQPLDSVFVNGKFTLGENIGDLGGVAAAYDGLQLYLKDKGRPGYILNFTPEQRFFISWATVWRGKYRDETLRNQILTDPHSPSMYRATGPIINLDEFFKAFDIKSGDPMYKDPEERIRIW